MVEDDDATRDLLALLFRDEGCEVEAARDGLAAMRAWWQGLEERRPFDLIVLDLAMPEMDGISVAQRIRGAEAELKRPAARIRGYTGHGDKLHSREALLSAGFDDVMIKPGDPEEFRRWARELRGTSASTES